LARAARSALTSASSASSSFHITCKPTKAKTGAAAISNQGVQRCNTAYVHAPARCTLSSTLEARQLSGSAPPA
jgi:hypothetical protein